MDKKKKRCLGLAVTFFIHHLLSFWFHFYLIQCSRSTVLEVEPGQSAELDRIRTSDM